MAMNPGSVSVRGEWPGLVVLRSGWWKGVARPLRDDTTDSALRIERGSTEFARRCAETLIGLGATSVHSPPLMPGSHRMWRDAGFDPYVELLLLERDLRRPVPAAEGVRVADRADRVRAAEIDSMAFPPEWRVGALGLEDALSATPDSVMLVTDAGYAIVGVSAQISYLQRIAVAPDAQGGGTGRNLLRGALAWARGRGARTMLLNTQVDNDRALGMYRSESFTVLPTRLTILRYRP